MAYLIADPITDSNLQFGSFPPTVSWALTVPLSHTGAGKGCPQMLRFSQGFGAEGRGRRLESLMGVACTGLMILCLG